MCSFGPDVAHGYAERRSDLPLDVEVPLLEIAIAERALDPRRAWDCRRPGSVKRARKVDGGLPRRALKEVVGSQERRVQGRGQDNIKDLDVPEDTIAATEYGLGAERRPGETYARGEFALGRIVDRRRLLRRDAEVRQRRAAREVGIESGEVVVFVGGGRVAFYGCGSDTFRSTFANELS